MVGPLEMAKLGNFLKDALLPLMAGDIGLAGVGGLGPFDPLPLPFGKVIGEGVKGAKAGVRAVRGAVRGADEAAEGGVAAARALDTEDVPIEFFDDMQGNPGVMAGEITDQARVDKLAASIAEDGITEPLILEFHPGTGLVWLGEGNHRLAAARQLGLDSVPVRGVRYEPTPSEVRLSGDGKRLSPYTLEHLNNDDWFGEAWVSESGERLQATFTPSQVGVPTASGVAREAGGAGLRVPMGERRVYPGAMSESGQAPWVDFVLSPAGGAADDMWGKPGRWTGREWGEGEWVPDEVFGEFDTNADAVIHQLESILGTDETLVGFDMAKDLAFDAGDIDSVFEIEQIIDSSVMKQARMLENPAQETVFRLKKELQLYKMMADETPGGLPEWLGNGGVGTDGAAGVDFTADWQDRFMEFVRALGDEPEIFGLDEDDLYRAVSARRPRLWTGEHAFPREELEGG